MVARTIDKDRTGVLNYGAERLYGRPDLILVSYLITGFETGGNTCLRRLVHSPSGRVFEVPEKDNVQGAAEAFAKTLAGV